MSDCIFCQIVEGTLPSTKLYEDDQVLAFQNIYPGAPIHALIIPKKHIASMDDVTDEEWPLIALVHKVAQQVARELGVAESGYRLVNNCGPNAGQEVFHLHYHLMAGARLSPLGTSNN
ncbi:histidine triad nucleotide-binding protein [Paenibacillus athensensis]|uniref:Histidine triad nucleotide-binding protein n=1 Tax=Paenibacillus athensensis TaxID=1967502 RepID=A0A4Y8PSI2_9BACL|nr:histidine triad nucleotide-binding protein [Paenibacillus athensensis]MCD1261581.1 histidine triad nucleotide-binding protein [Paenibacillus athensensis]